MLLSQSQDVLFTDQRLAARQKIEINAQLGSLGDNTVHVFIGQVVFMAVGAGPAADAVHVTGGGRVEKDQPRNVAVVDRTVLADHFGAAEKGLETKIQKSRLCDIGIGFVNDAVDHLEPAVFGIFDGGTNLIVGALAGIAIELFCHVDQLKKDFFAIFFIEFFQQRIHQKTGSGPLCFVRKG